MRGRIRARIIALGMIMYGMYAGAWHGVVRDEKEMPEIEQILSDCAVLWDQISAFDAKEQLREGNLVLEHVTELAHLITDLNRNVRNISCTCSPDVLYYLHDTVKQIALELSRQLERCELSTRGSAAQALLMLDLLDSEFERTYYYLDTLS